MRIRRNPKNTIQTILKKKQSQSVCVVFRDGLKFCQCPYVGQQDGGAVTSLGRLLETCLLPYTSLAGQLAQIYFGLQRMELLQAGLCTITHFHRTFPFETPSCMPREVWSARASDGASRGKDSALPWAARRSPRAIFTFISQVNKPQTLP